MSPGLESRGLSAERNCVRSLPALFGSKGLTRAVAIGSLLQVTSLLWALLSPPVKRESRILSAETHLSWHSRWDGGRGRTGARRPPRAARSSASLQGPALTL